MEKNRILFSDPDAMKVFSSVFMERHVLLIDKLSVYILPLCSRVDEGDRVFTSRFIAETLVTLTSRGIPFDRIYKIVAKLI